MYTKIVKLSQENKDKLLRGDIVIKAGTEALAKQIVDSEDEHGDFTLGKGSLFIFPYDECTVGIDNTRGNAWTEAFADYETCLAWLCGQFEISDYAAN